MHIETENRVKSDTAPPLSAHGDLSLIVPFNDADARLRLQKTHEGCGVSRGKRGADGKALERRIAAIGQPDRGDALIDQEAQFHRPDLEHLAVRPFHIAVLFVKCELERAIESMEDQLCQLQTSNHPISLYVKFRTRYAGDWYGSQARVITLTDVLIDTADAILVVTDHTGIDYADIRARARVFVDTRNAAGSVRAPVRDAVLV